MNIYLVIKERVAGMRINKKDKKRAASKRISDVAHRKGILSELFHFLNDSHT